MNINYKHVWKVIKSIIYQSFIIYIAIPNPFVVLRVKHIIVIYYNCYK